MLLGPQHPRGGLAEAPWLRSPLWPPVARLLSAILMACSPSLRHAARCLLPHVILVLEAFAAPEPQRADERHLRSDVAGQEVHVDAVEGVGRDARAVRELRLRRQTTRHAPSVAGR